MFPHAFVFSHDPERSVDATFRVAQKHHNHKKLPSRVKILTGSE